MPALGPAAVDTRRVLATLLDNLPGMAYRCRNDPDWTMEFVSGGCRELTGYAPEALIGNRATSYGALIHTDDRQRIYDDVRAALAQRRPFEYTYRIRRADGQWRWVWERGRGVFRADGTLDALEGFINDITDRVQAEDALRAERDRASQYLAIAGTIFVALHGDGTVALINRRGCEILGYPENEIVGRSWFEQFVPAAERTAVETTFRRLMAGDILPVEYFENTICTSRGERLIAWHNALLRDGDGRVVGTLSSGEDITDQRRAEREVAEAKRMLETASVTGQVALWEWDCATGALRWSPIIECMLGGGPGCTPHTLAAWEALIHPDDRGPVLKALYAHLRERQPFDVEYRVRTGSGNYRWWRDAGHAEWDAAGRATRMTGACVDISERRLAEEALQRRIVALTRPLDESTPVVFDDLFDIDELQRIQDAFAEATGVASIITRPDGTPITRPSGFRRLCDRMIRGTERGRANCFHSDAVIGRHNPSGSIVQRCLSAGLWDAGASITLGGRHVANWLIGQVKSASDDAADMARYAAEIGVDPAEYRAALAEVPAMAEEQFAKIAHALFLLANELSLKAFQNVQQARFIAERQAAEAALRVSEERFRAIFEQAGVGVAQVDSATGRFIRVNRKYADIVGRTPEALRATTVFAIVHPDDLPVLRAGTAQLAGPDGADLSCELRCVRPDGTIVWVRLTAVVMSAADEGNACHIAVVEDITSAREAAARQEQLEAQLHQAQKLEAIGRLAGGVAHDFNNLLTAILGHAELGLQAMGPAGRANPAVVESLTQIERSAQRAAALTRQLLAFSRRQVSQPAALDPAGLIRAAEPMLRRLLTENIALEVQVPPAVQAVRADEAQLEQVLLNLVVNARDALREGGRLTIRLEDVHLDQPDARDHGDLPPGAYVCLTVCDTGCGMDAATLERIFEPFFTTKELGRGTGLGLATVYGIVKQSGGHIAAQSAPGRGSTFRVWLPVAEAPTPAPAAATVHPPATAGHETILLCEDDETVRFLTAEMLRSAGYRVLLASGGTEARRIAADLATPPQLLVTDVIMPDINGRQLADELAVRWPDLRVLYLSGYTADIIAHHGVLDPGVEFLEKPYSRARLLARVREVLDRAPAGAPLPGDAVRASAGGAR